MTATDPNATEALKRIAHALERIADELSPLPNEPAPAKDDTTAKGDTTAEKWITVSEVAARYGVSEVLIHERVRMEEGGTLVIKRNSDELGRTLVAESSLPPLPEGPLCSRENAKQITGLNSDQLIRRMHAGRINGYRPFGIAQYRFPRASLLALAAEEARRAI